MRCAARRTGMGTPPPILERERQGRTEMDARLHCSETRALMEAKFKTIRFDSQRRRCVNKAIVQRGCRRRRGDKYEVAAMMKGHMQPRGGGRVTGMLHGGLRKLHDAWTGRRLVGAPVAVQAFPVPCSQCYAELAVPGDCSQAINNPGRRGEAMRRAPTVSPSDGPRPLAKPNCLLRSGRSQVQLQAHLCPLALDHCKLGSRRPGLAILPL